MEYYEDISPDIHFGEKDEILLDSIIHIKNNNLESVLTVDFGFYESKTIFKEKEFENQYIFIKF